MAPSEIEYKEGAVNYIIEAICDKRRVLQKKGESFQCSIEYYIKWRGLPTCENTWEPKEEIKNKALIEEFEQQRERLRAQNNAQAEDRREQPRVRMTEVARTGYKGFSRGLAAKRIAGTLFICGMLHFMMEWEDCDEMDLVPASIVNKKVPEMVIDFYEGRMTWRSLTAGRIVREEEERLRRSLIAENPVSLQVPGDVPSADAS